MMRAKIIAVVRAASVQAPSIRPRVIFGVVAAMMAEDSAPMAAASDGLKIPP